MSPYAFNGWRYLAASLFIFALARFRFPKRKTEIFGILVNGVLLFGGATLQQAGIALSTVGNTGFITTLYVVLVPFLSALFLKMKLTANALLAAALAAIGLYLLTTAGLGLARITPGDVIPAATPPSATSLNRPISPVRFTWVPSYSSWLLPISTTRTPRRTGFEGGSRFGEIRFLLLDM